MNWLEEMGNWWEEAVAQVQVRAVAGTEAGIEAALEGVVRSVMDLAWAGEQEGVMLLAP